MNLMMENLKFVKGLDPVADALAGTVNSDVVSMRNHGNALFALYKGVGATGDAVLTAEACDNFTPSNTTDVPFYYREINSGDTESAITLAAAAGFTFTVGSSGIIIVEVKAAQLAATGFPHVRLHSVEATNDPILGGILIILGNGRYKDAITRTAIA